MATHRIVHALTGDLDAFTAPALLHWVADVLASHPPSVVLLDLAELTFLDGRGAHTIRILSHLALSHGHKWGIVTQGNRWVHRVLGMLGWTEGLPLFPDQQSALQALCGEEVASPVG